MYTLTSSTVHYIPVKINLTVAVLVKVQYHKRLSSSHAWGSKQSCVKMHRQNSAAVTLTQSKLPSVKELFCQLQPHLYTDLSIKFYQKLSQTQQKASRAELRSTDQRWQHNTATIARSQSISDNRIFYRTYTGTNITQTYRCTFKNMLHGCFSTTLKIMFRLACTNTQKKLHRHKMAFFSFLSFKDNLFLKSQRCSHHSSLQCTISLFVEVSTSEYWFGCNGSKSLE